MKANTKWLTGLVLLAGLALLGFFFFSGGLGKLSDDSKGTRAAQLKLARTALAFTENLETEEAGKAWNALFEQLPQDRSVALNRALNQVLMVDALTESTTNPLLDAAAKQAARQQLPRAIEQARQAIKDFASVSDDEVTNLWLNSRIDLQEASLLPPSIAKSIRRDVFGRLTALNAEPVTNQPRGIILGGLMTRVLDELESPASGLANDLRSPAAQSLGTFSDQHPDNLFISLRAARLNIDAKSSRAVDAINRTLKLARAIEPSLRVQTLSIGLTPDELVKKITTAIEEEDWETADNQMLLWFNVLNSTDLVKTDRRRASPHPLDRLSFEVLRRLSAEVVQNEPILSGAKAIEFQSVAVSKGADIVFALPMDIDLDLDSDVVTLTKTGGIAVLKNDRATTWKLIGGAQLNIDVAGAFAADLFMVDASDSQRLQVSLSDSASGVEGGKAVSSAARHNTLLTLLVYGKDGARLVVVDGRDVTSNDNRIQVLEKPTGLEDIREVRSAITGDFDGDGDLDLMFATGDRGIRIFINRGNRTFFEAREPKDHDEFGRERDIASMAIVDLDRDLDLDVVTLNGTTGKIGLIENLLHLQFRYCELNEISATAGASQVEIADLDGNVSWDLIVGGGAEAKIVYSQTADSGAWTVERIESIRDSAGPFLSADFDNDSWFEILFATNGEAAVKRLAGSRIEDLPMTPVDFDDGTTAISDFDLDGKQDVLVVSAGDVSIYQNKTQAPRHHLDVRFRGIDDNNANSGRVNHYAIGSVLELRFGPHYRAKVITSPSTHFGIDGFDQADSLRVIFPNGLTQTIRNPAVDAILEEEQTLKGSCPYLYAWDGEKYAFVTDCLWAAPLGLQVAAGVVAQDRPWEYLKVDGDYLKVRDGKYELRITEELWEVAYFDHVSLTAVDHPADVDIWTNEKVGPAAIAKPTIYAFGQEGTRLLKNAQDTFGRDVTNSLATIDQKFVQGFDRRLRQGLCPPHWIDLNFGELPKPGGEDESVYLVLTGWILPTDTSLNIQIDQNPEMPSIEFPSVWVPDADGEGGWREAIPFMGFPGGKTKTIVVDVTTVLNQDDPRFRIRTSAQIYWDAASLVIQATPSEFLTHDLAMLEADLRYHGFSKRSQLSSQMPDTYEHAAAVKTPKWPPLQGRFTQFGNCEALLESWDDSMVVMGSGDELRLCFESPANDPPAGWKRDFVLHCVGWDKDADLNTLAGQSSLPLPFRSMREYPPTQLQAAERDQSELENESHLNRTQSFRKFWNR